MSGAFVGDTKNLHVDVFIVVIDKIKRQMPTHTADIAIQIERFVPA